MKIKGVDDRKGIILAAWIDDIKEDEIRFTLAYIVGREENLICLK
jgi:hypothetical protein